MHGNEQELTVDSGIAEALAQVAIEAAGAPDLPSTLGRIAVGAAETVEAAEHAHIATFRGREARIVAATSPAIQQLAEAMYQLGQGPGPAAIKAHRTITSGDLADDDRWPAFAARAAEHGIRSMMSLPLHTNGRSVIGSLSLYSPETAAFDAEDEHLAEVFSLHATVVLLGELDRTQLRTAVSSRDLIGTAKGILMCQRSCTDEQAFELLSAASQRANVKLRDVAAWIVADVNKQAGTAGKGRSQTA
jgi:GAF domain-containing protein